MDIHSQDSAQELERLSRADRITRREAPLEAYSTSYSRFVRSMRLVLPLLATAVVVILFFLNNYGGDSIIPVHQNEKVEHNQVITNEFINPQFESADKKHRPYKISAQRAIQGTNNKDLVMLEKPIGEMKLESGEQIIVQSSSGAYRQDTERFYLQGQVDLKHDGDYRLKTDEAHVDLRNELAWTEVDVFAHGPDISIQAKGMVANGKTGEIVFNGPAKLVLEEGFKGIP